MLRALPILALSILALSACHPKTTQAERVAMVQAQATGPNAMWYRFKFDADYGGQPVSFDQFVFCGAARTPMGGPNGNTYEVTFRPQPQTIAQSMEDGSQILLRVPDMCKKHRAALDSEVGLDHAVPKGPFGQPAWVSNGPFEILPLAIWSDKTPVEGAYETQPNRVEAYVGQGYYEHPDARFTGPVGLIEFMPVGFHPDDHSSILSQETAYPTLRHITTNIYSGEPDSHDFIYGIHPEFRAHFTLKISDLNAYADEHADEGRYDNDGEWRDLSPDHPEPIEGFSHPKFSLFGSRGKFTKGNDDPDYLTPRRALACIEPIMSGDPITTSIPPRLAKGGYRRRPLNLEVPHERKALERYLGQSQIRQNCAQNLDTLVSFDIVEGRFDMASNVPGAIVYQRWYRPNPERPPNKKGSYSTRPRFLPTAAFQMALETEAGRRGAKYTLGSDRFEVEGAPASAGQELIGTRRLLQDQITNEWKAFATTRTALRLSEFEALVDMYYSPDQD